MTALTWAQRKKLTHCDCPLVGAVSCARSRGADSEPCACPCHGYYCNNAVEQKPNEAREK